jgi:hypothetical protein
MLLIGVLTKNGLFATVNYIVIIYFLKVFFSFFISSEEFSQNIGIYTILWCIPLLMLQDQSKSKNILICLAFFSIFITFKRGAILALIISSSLYLLFYAFIQKSYSSVIRSFFLFFVLLFSLIFAMILVNEIKPDFFEGRTSDIVDKKKFGSGRASFFPYLFGHYKDAINSRPINFFFGFGSRSVQKISSGYYAHSDWLQLLHDYGIFGLIVMLWLHLAMLRMFFIGFHARFKFCPAFIMIYISLFLLNIYSGMLFSAKAIFFGIFVSLYYYLWVKKTKIASNKNDHSSA